MDCESSIPSPVWTGTIEVEPVGPIFERSGLEFRTQTLKAFRDEIPQGRLAIQVYEVRRMVELVLAETDDRGGGGDTRREGGGRALMDRLEELYPAPEWWFAADPRHDHSPAGRILMQSRCRAGRRWVHSTACVDPRPVDCPCIPSWLLEDTEEPGGA